MSQFHQFSPVATAIGAGCIGRTMAWDTMREALAQTADPAAFRALVTESASYLAYVSGRSPDTPLSRLKRDKVAGAATLALYSENLLWYFKRCGTFGLDTLTARGCARMRADEAAAKGETETAAKGETETAAKGETETAAAPVFSIADAIAAIRIAAETGALTDAEADDLRGIVAGLPVKAPATIVQRVEPAPLALAA